MGDMADYVVETDRGHYVTRDEVYDILRQAEDNGFVHQITNIDGENKILRHLQLQRQRVLCPAHLAAVQHAQPVTLGLPRPGRADKCVACGKCVEVCPAGAAKLGQKLCSKKARTVEYPRQAAAGRQPLGRAYVEPEL